MAHKKAGGSSRNGRDSQSKRLGVKVYGGERVNAGQILVRQICKVLKAFEIVWFVWLDRIFVLVRVLLEVGVYGERLMISWIFKRE